MLQLIIQKARLRNSGLLNVAALPPSAQYTISFKDPFKQICKTEKENDMLDLNGQRTNQDSR